MHTIPSVRIDTADASALQLLESESAGRGSVSNMLKTMAHSYETLDGYLYFAHSLEGSSLHPVLAEQIALTVAQLNQCEYSLAEHTAAARRLGLDEVDIVASREGRVANKRSEAALRFARSLVRRNGEYELTDLRRLRYSDREIIEIIACVAVNMFANMFNLVAEPELDFERVEVKVQAA